MIAMRFCFLCLLACATPIWSDPVVAQACPLPADAPREMLDGFVERIDPNETPTPEGLLKAIRKSARALQSPEDSAICRRLNELDAKPYLEATWGDVAGAEYASYPRYEVGYFQAGSFFIFAATSTPTPQPENLSRTRIVTGYVPLVVYDSELEKLGGWSL